VNVITNSASTAYNADKSKIVASLVEPGMVRVHINNEDKIDLVYYYWDTSKLTPQVVSATDNGA
jgi:hypothetical protein